MSDTKKTSKAAPVSLVEDFSNTITPENSEEIKYPVNIRETEHKYELELTAPGFKKSDFNITTHGGLLTITAEIDSKENVNEDNYIRKEFLRYSFGRAFRLPENVIDDHVDARYHNGMLIIDLKKNDRYTVGKKHVKVD
jgi:HSP20 family protein